MLLSFMRKLVAGFHSCLSDGGKNVKPIIDGGEIHCVFLPYGIDRKIRERERERENKKKMGRIIECNQHM